MTKEGTEAETAPESPAKEPDAIVEEAVVTEEIAAAETAPESPVKEPELLLKKQML